MQFLRLSRHAAICAWLVVVATASGAAAQTDPTRGALHLRVDPLATLYVDGRLVSAASAEHFTPLPPGVHRVRVVHSEFEDWRRTIDVRGGDTVRLNVALRNQGVSRQRAGARRPVSAVATHPDLKSGITFYGEGDLEAAGSVLEAVLKDLAGVPRAMRDRAAAAIFYGATLVDLQRAADAGAAFALARQLDRTLQPTAAEFSADVLAEWKRSTTVTFVDVPSMSDPTAAPESAAVSGAAGEPPATAPPAETLLPTGAPATAPAGAAASAPADPAVEFVVETEAATSVDVVEVSTTGTCEGVLGFDREAKVMTWAGTRTGCREEFSVPFAEVRNPAAAPRGGILLQFRSDRPSLRVMPRPDADVVGPDAVPMTLAELPPSTRVNMRRAQRAMTRALGRPINDSIFGLQVDVPLAELLASPADYDGSAVRVAGPLGTGTSRGQFVIGTRPEVVGLLPGGVAAAMLQSNAPQWLGKEIVVTGTFSRPPPTPGARDVLSHVLTVASVEPAVESEAEASSTIESITTAPPPPRVAVRIIGQFRGANSFGDLPLAGRREHGWVIKDGAFAVWVIGKPPAGQGFKLESGNRADSQAWLAVTGTVEEIRGTVYLRANKVELVPAPLTGRVEETRVARLISSTPPAIAFVAPVPDVEEASPEQQFVVRFSKRMKEGSFDGRVLMRYADAPTSPFPAVSVTYYPDRTNSIMVDPGVVLDAGRTVELVLQPGIEDVDGVLFIAAGGADRILSWRVAGR